MNMSTITKEHRDVLVKAVSIAKANGFNISDSFFIDMDVEDSLFDGMKSYYNIIFSHDFARAFWTEEVFMEVYVNDEGDPWEVDLVDTLISGNHPIAALAVSTRSLKIPMWQYNILQMSLSEDPLMYIKSTLTEMGIP